MAKFRDHKDAPKEALTEPFGDEGIGNSDKSLGGISFNGLACGVENAKSAVTKAK